MQPERSSQIYSYKYSQNSFLYDVKREIYNEENFQQEHRRRASSSGTMDINITTFRHHVQCRCSWHRFLRCMYIIFPFLEWTYSYRFKDWLLGDLLAGLSVGIVQIPQGLTLSLMIRQLIPPLNVAYTSFCSSVIYVIFGSCHQMSIGPFFLVSALMINVLKERPFNYGHLVMGTFLKDDFTSPYFYTDYNRSLSVVQTTTFLTGIFQLSMGMFGVGFLATYLPEAMIGAYLAAVALHIMLSELTCVLGIVISFHAGPISFFYNIVNYCIGLPKANSTSILLFLTTVVALRINKCIKFSFNQYPINCPVELFLILGFTVFAHKINLVTENSATFIDMIPYSFLFPSVPVLDHFLPRVLLPAASLSFVSSFMLIFLGKKIASLHNYRINSNQDLIAIGLCNVVSSFFKSCVYTAAFARTIIQDKTGGRQQFASLVGAGVMLLLMVKVGQFFYDLPNAVLAGVILSNVMPYLETIYNLPTLWRQNQHDFVLWILTFLSAIFLGLDIGLLVSLVCAFFIFTVRSHRTKILTLGQIPNTNIYRSINDYREVTSIPGVKIFQCCNSITFVNVYHLKDKLLKEVGMVRVPLKEEEIFRLFNQNESHLHDKLCRCTCNCDELETPPRIIYTERFENKQNLDSSSINLVRCSHLDSINMSQSLSDDQVPNTGSSTSQRNQEQNYEDVEKVRLANHPSRNSLLPLPEATESQELSTIPYSDRSYQPSIHTIILDFSMVHYVDFQALVVLRQMCNAFQNANILVLMAGCHPSVVRMFEKNDFFDAGITKAQLFLSLHDAVLFASSRKFTELSELSDDESETVIQETYSDVNKNDIPRFKMGSNFPESKKNPSPSFAKAQQTVEEESEFDLEMEPMLESEQDVRLDSYLDQELENESELEPRSDLEPDTEPQSELELEPETEVEPETDPEPKTPPEAYTYPRRHHWQPHSGVPQTQSQTRPQTPSMERRGQHMNYSTNEYNDHSWEANWE
ncbi:testis anion transporter 1 [Sciurus carolinensis]|uniref:testis anion transporter 1 n=1 Tax=Sciurus carolinensis TaxID=30640 RepID=UPI001FB2AB3A|nr:testis anion transporter 1 [Sciurus carolinensis]